MFFRRTHFLKRLYGARPAPKLGTNKEDLSRMSLQATGLFLTSGALLMGYFFYEKQKISSDKESLKNESIGKPKVGGPFCLVRDDGVPVTERDFAGKYMLIYFGYTFCPDVCPEELEKMAEIYNELEKNGKAVELAPIFVSCDPKRDSIEALKSYLADFHSKFIGLTGTHSQILKVAKQFRLYFSAPPRALDDDDSDYLVDHSIFFYLMGPNGEFLSHFGRNETAPEITSKILQFMQEH